MISILIPTYERDCSRLVYELNAQCEKLTKEYGQFFQYEIIVSDDCSSVTHYEYLKEKLAIDSHCQLIHQTKNKGRSTNINILVRDAKYEWIILIDDDAEICTTDFIEQYWKHRQDADVICGTLRNPDCKISTGHELRFVYEQSAERRRTIDYKNCHPYEAFTTFNIMFKKKVLQLVPFDERCKEYGYEDALLGIILEIKGFSILHINNPLIHSGIDSNIVFLQKTEASLRTLRQIGMPMQGKAGPSRTALLFEQFHLTWLLKFLFKLLQKSIRRNLLGRHPKVFLLNVYKLLYYAQL